MASKVKVRYNLRHRLVQMVKRLTEIGEGGEEHTRDQVIDERPLDNQDLRELLSKGLIDKGTKERYTR